jgi:hypothetical protein
LSRLRLGLVDCVRARIENLQHSAS